MNMDISDLMVRGFEIFDVSVDDSKVYYTLKMKVLDDKMVKYPPVILCVAPVILCVVSLKDLNTACLDIN